MKFNDRDYLKILYCVSEVKEKARKYNLLAEYVPVAGYIEILDKERNVIGITFNGITIKESLSRQYFNMDKWLNLFDKSLSYLSSLKFD